MIPSRDNTPPLLHVPPDKAMNETKHAKLKVLISVEDTALMRVSEGLYELPLELLHHRQEWELSCW